LSAPSIIAVSPNPSALEVVLGTSIVVTFDQLIDTTTINATTFSLTGPGQTQLVSPTELNSKTPRPATGREYINGTFSFAVVSGNTVCTFTPSKPLRPNVTYTVLVIGGLGSVLGARVQNTASPAETLDSNYQWNFTTGDLDISVPPITSPLTPLFMPLDPSKVKISQQVWSVGNDLSQELSIVFPANIDTSTVSVDQILLSLEAILDDPSVCIPSGLIPTVTINGNTISIVISGWPAQ
jgi:hypothetical protein